MNIEIFGPKASQEIADQWERDIERTWNGPTLEFAERVAELEGLDPRNLSRDERSKVDELARELMAKAGVQSGCAHVNCCRILFVVDVKLRETETDPEDMFEGEEGYHQVRVLPLYYERTIDGKTYGFLTRSSSEQMGADDGSGTGNWSDNNGRMAAHETGHLLGVDDKYDDVPMKDPTTGEIDRHPVTRLPRVQAVAQPGHENDLMGTGIWPSEQAIAEILKLGGVECDCCEKTGTAAPAWYFSRLENLSSSVTDAIEDCSAAVLERAIGLLEEQRDLVNDQNMSPTDRVILNGKINGLIEKAEAALEDCEDDDRIGFLAPSDTDSYLASTELVSFLDYGTGWAVTYDNAEWCTYGGGTTPLDSGSTTVAPSMGSVATPPGPIAQGGPNSVVNLGGTNFAPNSNVTIQLVQPDSEPVNLASVPTNASGTFVTPITIPNVPDGSYAFLIRDEDGNEGETPFEVTPPDEAPSPEQSQQQQSSAPSAPAFLIVKATKAAMAGGPPHPVVGAMVKLDAGAPLDLPIAGNERDDSGYDESPVQGVTMEDGSVHFAASHLSPNVSAFFEAGFTDALALATTDSSPIVLASNPYLALIDLTPQASTNVHFGVDTSLTGWDQPATYLHPDLVPYLTRHWVLNGTMVAVLHYPQDREAAVEELISLSRDVLLSETNFCRTKQQQPDPYFLSRSSWGEDYDDQWAIKRVGFTPDPGSAWNLVTGEASPIVVAVVDSGLDWNHQDISWDSIWNNEDETPDNGIDDDANGYVDDVIGWDFFNDHNNPWDQDGHGTFVAGVIAASKDNGIGIAGINPHAKIMVLKALNSFGHTRASFVAEAIIYAADNGARVINLSVGGSNLTSTEQQAIDYAHAKGVVIVAAAGNEGVDAGEYGPAGADHVITVAATDYNDQRAAFSNWGPRVDIAAPGIDVLSLRARRTDVLLDIPGVEYRAGEGFVGEDKRYFRGGGTSFSAPIVAGVASLILAYNPDLSGEDATRMLLQSTRDIEGPGKDQLTGFGLVDAGAALVADPEFLLSTEITEVGVVQDSGATYVQVLGTLDANVLQGGWLEIGRGEEPTEWKRIEGLTEPVRDGVLGRIPAESFSGSSVWTIRLLGEHRNGRTREVRFRLDLQ